MKLFFLFFSEILALTLDYEPDSMSHIGHELEAYIGSPLERNGETWAGISFESNTFAGKRKK